MAFRRFLLYLLFITIILLLSFLNFGNQAFATCFNPNGATSINPWYPVCQDVISSQICACGSSFTCVQVACNRSIIVEDCGAYTAGGCGACMTVDFSNTGNGYCTNGVGEPNPNRCNWDGLYFCPVACTTGAVGCSACTGGSPGPNACGNVTGSQTCTHNQPQVCINTPFTTSCTHFVNNCNSAGYSGYTCNGSNICVTSITGKVWFDTNNDGIQQWPSENGANNITLTDSNTGATRITSGNGVNAGSYAFNDTRSGTHTISVTGGIPAGYKQSPRTPNPQTFNITSPATANFAIVPVFTISGTVYNDYNANATKDTGEPGVANITVTATNAIDGGSAVSAANGIFTISNLSPGTYTITFSNLPANYITSPNPLNLNITVGPNSTNNNIGITRLFSISGTVYNDLDKNSHFGAGDTAFTSGTTSAHLVGGPNNIITDTPATTNGTFTTGNTLYAGTYTVTLTQPSPLPGGYTLEYPPGATYSLTVGDPAGNPACNAGGYNDATCSGAGDITGANFALNNENAWLQFGPVSGLFYTVSGDVRDDSALGFQDLVPLNPPGGPYVVLYQGN